MLHLLHNFVFIYCNIFCFIYFYLGTFLLAQKPGFPPFRCRSSRFLHSVQKAAASGVAPILCAEPECQRCLFPSMVFQNALSARVKPSLLSSCFLSSSFTIALSVISNKIKFTHNYTHLPDYRYCKRIFSCL